MPTRPILTALSLCALTACSTYDFARARLPDGSLDTKKLIADLEASGKHSLDQGTWIPLIYLELTTFEKSDDQLPEGYTLTHLKSFGPLFFAGGNDMKILAKDGASVEARDREWAGWGVLYHDHDSYVGTPYGTRREKHERFLLLFGSDHVLYPNDRN
jgi:hypothetical protein